MKIAVAFLLVAVSCCFNLASANYMKRCTISCRQSLFTDMKCLKDALDRNPHATIIAMANVLCAYDRCKGIQNKSELMRELKNLQKATLCPLGNIIGKDLTLEALTADATNILWDLLIIVVDTLRGLNVGSLKTPCGFLAPLLTKVTKILNTLEIPGHGGRIQNVAELNGGKDLLETVEVTSPGLVPSLLHILLGPACNPVRRPTPVLVDQTGLIGVIPGLTGGVLGTVKELGIGEMIDDTTGALTGILGNVNQIVSEVPKAIDQVTGEVVETADQLTESLVGSGGTSADLNIGVTGKVSGKAGGKYLGQPDVRLGERVLTAQQNDDASESYAQSGLLGNLVGGLLGGSSARKSRFPQK